MTTYLSENTQVLISPDAEHLAGEVVWIVDVEPGTSHPYCVSIHRHSTNVVTSHWVRAQDLTPTAQPRLPKPLQPARQKHLKLKPGELGVGSRVTIHPSVPFGPRVGYIQAITTDSVKVTRNRYAAPVGNIWIKRRYVTVL